MYDLKMNTIHERCSVGYKNNVSRRNMHVQDIVFIFLAIALTVKC